jgi:hypothetical protein
VQVGKGLSRKSGPQILCAHGASHGP